MEFVRSRKAQSAFTSRPPQGQSRTENIPLDHVSRESDSPKDVVTPQRPRVEEMEEEGKDRIPPPSAVIGTEKIQSSPLFSPALSFFAESAVFFVLFQTVKSLLGW